MFLSFSFLYLNASFSMSAYYKESDSSTAHGQWVNQKVPFAMQGLRSNTVNDKYRTWFSTWSESKNERIIADDDIPIIPTLEPIAAPRPAQSLILKIKGERDEKNIQILKIPFPMNFVC